ncbi:TonB-dependent receptor [Porticoccaceae bacterium LTM1]|nr:TonB-dependent receptor [Porticoccaceae bacterium LTM1]
MRCLSLSSLLLITSFNAFADEEEDLLSVFGDEELVSIATGYKKPISKAPAVASVITSDDIKKLGATDLDQVLETVPGLHVAINPISYGPIYTFRGIYSDFNPQVLMLVNGVPITNIYLGNRSLVWGGMPVEAISRIEIIRGPGSAVYGADAFAGVINVITKDGKEMNGLNSGVRYGSFNTVQGWAQYGGETDNFTYGFSLEYEDTDGQDEIIASDLQSFFDSLTGTSTSYAPGGVNTGRESYELRADVASGFWRIQSGLQHREIQSGAGAAQILDPNNISQSDRFNTSVSYINDQLAEGALTFSVVGSYLSTTQEMKEDLVLFPPGSTGPNFDPITNVPLFVDGSGNIMTYPDGMIGNPEVYEKHYRLDVSALYSGVPGNEIRTGFGYYRGDQYRVKDERNFGINPQTGLPILPGDPLIDVSDTPYSFITEGDRTNYYGFIQDAWQMFNDWELTAGIRVDDYSDFGTTINPRMAVVWSTSQTLTSKLLFGKAFRAPSFAEMRNQNNPAVLGNPDLEPEEIKSYEMAFDYRPAHNLNLKLNLFYYEWSDIISFVADTTGTTRTAQNAGEQTGHGFELEGVWKASEVLSFSGNYASVDSTDKQSDSDSANSPGSQLYLRADMQLSENWSFNLQSNWVRDRNRMVFDMRPEVDDYITLDSSLRFKTNDNKWQVALISKNLLDEEIYEPSPAGVPVPSIPGDLPMAGRSVMAEIRMRLQ